MPKKQSAKKRTQVKDLPAREKELSPKETKKVKGGYSIGGTTYEVDKVVRPQDATLKKPGT